MYHYNTKFKMFLTKKKKRFTTTMIKEVLSSDPTSDPFDIIFNSTLLLADLTTVFRGVPF